MTNQTPHTEPSAHPPSGQLSEYLDESLAPVDRRRVDEHMAQCAVCRVTFEELRAVAARALRLDEGPVPRTDLLWDAIEPRLSSRRAAWRPRLLAFDGAPWVPHAAAVAAACCLLAAVWLALDGRHPNEPLDSRPMTAINAEAPGDRAYDDTVADLKRVVRARLTHDPQVLAVLEVNLDAIDVAIADYDELLSARPGDPRLRDRLTAARQRKLEMLQRAAALSEVAN